MALGARNSQGCISLRRSHPWTIRSAVSARTLQSALLCSTSYSTGWGVAVGTHSFPSLAPLPLGGPSHPVGYKHKWSSSRRYWHPGGEASTPGGSFISRKPGAGKVSSSSPRWFVNGSHFGLLQEHATRPAWQHHRAIH